MIYNNISQLISNKKYRLVDKNTKSVICLGKYVNAKFNCGLIPILLMTFDNKWFWHLKSDKYQLEDVDDNIDNIAFNKIAFPNLKCEYWRNFNQKYDIFHTIYFADVFEENTIDELDLEVKDIVQCLNSINGIETCSSCSGHNNKPAYIDIKFYSIDVLFKICKILSLPLFRYDFVLKTAKTHAYFLTDNLSSKCITDTVMLLLRTLEIGQAAYDKLNELCKTLNEILNIDN